MDAQVMMSQDLAIPDVSTPEGLAAFQDLLRLAMELTCRYPAIAGAAAAPSVPVDQGSSGGVACRTLRVDDGGGQLPDDETGALSVGCHVQVDGGPDVLDVGHRTQFTGGPGVLDVGHRAQVAGGRGVLRVEHRAPAAGELGIQRDSRGGQVVDGLGLPRDGVAAELDVLPDGQVAQVADEHALPRGAHAAQVADGLGVVRDGHGVQVAGGIDALSGTGGAHVAANGQSYPGTATAPFYSVEVLIPGTAPTDVGVPSNASTCALTPTSCSSAGSATASTGFAHAATSCTPASSATLLTAPPSYGALHPDNIAPPVPSSGYRVMTSSVKNAIIMIPPFDSDSFTVEKARDFWTAFERATIGLDGPLRLIAFRNRLKGKAAEEWWLYSQIHDFETLRIRFHNQFAFLTPQQILQRLNTARRSRGMSAEVWGDRISELCDDAKCFDPLMRYQYFLCGLRNSTWEKLLRSTIVNSIPEAVAFLLYNNMQLPVENDADFVDEATNEPVVGSTNAYVSAENDADFTEKSMAEPAAERTTLMQMMELLQQNQNLMAQQKLELSRGTQAATVAYESQDYRAQPSVPAWTSARTLQESFRSVRQEPDTYTPDGRVVCGRCRTLGCSRCRCWRVNAICSNCQTRGHVAAECGVSNGRREEGDREDRVRYGDDWRSSYGGRITKLRTVQYPTNRTYQRTIEQSAQANVPALEPSLDQHGRWREPMNASDTPSAHPWNYTEGNTRNTRMKTFPESQSASGLVGAVGSVRNDNYTMIGAANETGTTNRLKTARRQRSIRKERTTATSGPVPWELLLHETTVNAEGPVRKERPENRERLLNAPLRMERAEERTMDTRLRERRDEQLVPAKASPDEEIASEPAAMVTPREEPTTTRTEPSRPPKGERDCVPQPEGAPYYYEPPVSWDQVLECSSGPAQVAAVMKAEDPGVRENAVDEERTPGVPSAGPFKKEGPSVTSAEVAALPNGEEPVEHEKTTTTTVSVCTEPKCRCRESLPVKTKNITFEVPGVGSQESKVRAVDIGAPALNKNQPYNELTADELGEPDPNYPSDTTEFIPNLKILHEDTAGRVPRTLDEDASLDHGERVVAATVNSADPVADTYCEEPTTEMDETTNKEDDTGSPSPHVRLTAPDGHDTFARDAATVVMKLKREDGTKLEERISPRNEIERTKKMSENAALGSRTPRSAVIRSASSDERDVGGGAEFAKGSATNARAPRMSTVRCTSSDERDVGGGVDDHGGVAGRGGLVEVGEGPTSDSVTGTAVRRGGGARAGTPRIHLGAVVEVRELHAPLKGCVAPAPSDGVEFGAVKTPDGNAICCSVPLLNNCYYDAKRFARERKSAAWIIALLSVCLLGTIVFVSYVCLFDGRPVACLMMCSAARA